MLLVHCLSDTTATLDISALVRILHYTTLVYV